MRKRWTEERRLQREQADWIVGFLRENGPPTTREIIDAMKVDGKITEPCVLDLFNLLK